MSEVITEKDKEYEAREEANAPGADQAMSDRVNNRSLRPNSSAFIDFMKTGWRVPCWCSTLSTRIRPRRRPARRMRPSCSSPRAPTPPHRTSS